MLFTPYLNVFNGDCLSARVSLNFLTEKQASSFLLDNIYLLDGRQCIYTVVLVQYSQVLIMIGTINTSGVTISVLNGRGHSFQTRTDFLKL